MPCWADFTIATRGYSFRKGQRYCDASNPSQNEYLEEGGIRFLMADEIGDTRVAGYPRHCETMQSAITFQVSIVLFTGDA